MKNSGWDSIYKKEGDLFKEVMPYMKDFAKLLKNKNVDKILDLGCGGGKDAFFLAKKGFKVYGIDSSKTAIKFAKKKFLIAGSKAKLIVADMNKKIPFEDSFFDCIYSIHSIHHTNTKNLKQIIYDVLRMLKPGGIFFIVVPKSKTQGKNFKKFDERTYIPIDGIEKGVPHFYFNKKIAKIMLKGFDIEEMRTAKATSISKGAEYRILCRKIN